MKLKPQPQPKINRANASNLAGCTTGSSRNSEISDGDGIAFVHMERIMAAGKTTRFTFPAEEPTAILRRHSIRGKAQLRQIHETLPASGRKTIIV